MSTPQTPPALAGPATPPSTAAFGPPPVNSAFGLRFRSALACGGTRAADPATTPDIDIRLSGPLPDLDPNAIRGHRFQAEPGRLLLRTHFIADYLVADGRTIDVAPKPDADTAAICNLLYGWATGGLLIQRGVPALHASTVEVPSGAVAFCGDSGVGKSTLVTLLMRRGRRVLDDNIAAIQLGADQAGVQPGLGSLRLLENTLAFAGIEPSGLATIGKVRPKYLYPLADGEYCGSALPLRRICVLQRGPAPARRRLVGKEKLEQLHRHAFVSRFAPGLGRAGALFAAWLALARQVEMELVTVPMDRSPQAWADQVDNELGAL